MEQVELITNPSARFDPMLGILNIVLKKNKLEGITPFKPLTAPATTTPTPA